MKYILEETTHKYVLSEKYILTEKNRRTEARSLEQGQELIKNYISKFISRITGHGNYKVINPEAAGVPSLEDKDLKPDLRHLLTNNEEGWLQADENNLSYWAELKAKRLRAEEKLIIDDKSRTIQIKTEDKEEEYKYSLEDDSIEINKGNKYILKVKVEPKKDFEASFKTENEEIAVVDNNGTITAISAGETNIIVEVDAQILKCVVKVNDIKDKDQETQDDPEPSENVEEDKEEIDWEAKYNKAIDKDSVWEEYLETVWFIDRPNNEIDRIKAISKAFRQECITYGFDNTNQFITFIKETYLKTTMTDKCYNAIHNAIVDQKIAVKDIIGDGVLGKYNIIFCADLYNQDPANITKYLKRQKDIVSKETPKDTFNSKTEFVVNIMYKLNGFTKIESITNIANQKLNTFAKINELEKEYTGTVSGKDEDDKKDIKINNDLIEKIGDIKEAASILGIMSIKFANSKPIADIVLLYKEVIEWLNKSTTGSNLRDLIKETETKFGINGINAKQAVTLVDKIITSNKFTFTKV